ncbi:universal stress protein [Streptomyces roseirectus]|uniref:Universal stress protein n=1 Tax=Streptomyces roseirectus TaxID=2768066 RepID=A0A7H0I650_9ACTN|nr:universal stress protein [Streptomyces roseirectus]QNP68266.1 universal stress protein [Streptomyces roseirectus]
MQRVVVVGVDRSLRARDAAGWAAGEAVRRSLPLRVVHVTPPGGPEGADGWPHHPEQAVALVAAELTARHPGLAVECRWPTGVAAHVIGAHAAASDLIVLGLRGEGGRAGLALGSTASAVAATARCPVVLVPSRPGDAEPPRRQSRITAAVDARDPAEGALGFAFDSARLHGAWLHTLHAEAGPGGKRERVAYADRSSRKGRLLAHTVRPWQEKYPDVRVWEDVALCGPVTALADASRGTGLLVLGRRAGARGLGPVADAVARRTRCPLAVVPG